MNKLRIVAGSGVKANVDPRCPTSQMCSQEQLKHGGDVGYMAVGTLAELVGHNEVPPIQVEITVTCPKDCPGLEDDKFSGQPGLFRAIVKISPQPKAKKFEEGLHL